MLRLMIYKTNQDLSRATAHFESILAQTPDLVPTNGFTVFQGHMDSAVFERWGRYVGELEIVPIGLQAPSDSENRTIVTLRRIALEEYILALQRRAEDGSQSRLETHFSPNDVYEFDMKSSTFDAQGRRYEQPEIQFRPRTIATYILESAYPFERLNQVVARRNQYHSALLRDDNTPADKKQIQKALEKLRFK